MEPLAASDLPLTTIQIIRIDQADSGALGWNPTFHCLFRGAFHVYEATELVNLVAIRTSHR